ncbi:hypothetical protein PoB_007077900 [Plakobranchus ocellatus]|uniref:3-beta hydroxysteroid dehydrogenase/isomerase domain-containing protein n=1 Tax=Plakobranchus ocellatus TaxID=259542 RepID=A0AAV4DJB0_9GAST|nr:hypothetical protein PoB_007077900 [Plakobranchus ocellatus]
MDTDVSPQTNPTTQADTPAGILDTSNGKNVVNALNDCENEREDLKPQSNSVDEHDDKTEDTRDSASRGETIAANLPDSDLHTTIPGDKPGHNSEPPEIDAWSHNEQPEQMSSGEEEVSSDNPPSFQSIQDSNDMKHDDDGEHSQNASDTSSTIDNTALQTGISHNPIDPNIDNTHTGSSQTKSKSEAPSNMPEKAAQLSVTISENGSAVEGDNGGDIVVVTGGSGFLGQHVVKMLQQRAPHVSEIRVLDVKEFVQKLEYTAAKPVKSLVGSVADSKFVSRALKGVHSVIHVAGLISWGTFPDFAGMEEANVVGTVNVFNACIKNNVQRLVYCSTVDVAVGFQPVNGGDEENTRVPPADGFMFPGYPETKYQGERVVLNSERVPRQDGGTLQTVILRANVLYGELDHAYVTNGLRAANQSKGVLRQIGDGMAMFQQAYVGNTAWAFVRADAAMRENPALNAEVFYVPDNTPVQNSFNFMRPYLEARGFRLSEDRLSYTLVHSAVRVAEIVAKGLSPIYKLNLPVQSYSIMYINTSIHFRAEKARKMLGYEPIFTPSEARQASLEYYKTVDLDNNEG